MIAHRLLANVLFKPYDNLIWQLPESANKRIYLTFDDGPYPPVTQRVLNILAEQQVPATFFLSGQQLFQYRHRLSRLNYAGHAIGNHLFHHSPLFGWSRQRLLKEINLTDQIIVDHLDRLPTTFRPPYGVFSPQLFPALQSTSKKLVLWSVLTNDFKWDRYRVLENLYRQVRPGDILVFHDSPKTCAVLPALLPDFIRYCRSRGWEFGIIN